MSETDRRDRSTVKNDMVAVAAASSAGRAETVELSVIGRENVQMVKHTGLHCEGDVSGHKKLRARINEIMRETFRVNHFRSTEQRKALETVAKRGGDIVLAWCTDVGTSLCYQVPTVLHRGVTIVFCPTLATITKEVSRLTSLGITAVLITPGQSTQERGEIIDDLMSDEPEAKFLFMHPLYSVNPAFKSIAQHLQGHGLLAYIVVNQAHCVSAWSHEYRAEYLQLTTLKEICPGTPWITLTGTCTHNVIKDTIGQLKLASPILFKASSLMLNVFYDVVYKELLHDPIGHLIRFLTNGSTTVDDVASQYCAVVFVHEKVNAESLAKQMSERGVLCAPLHGGVDCQVRQTTLQRWSEGRIAVIVATSAFFAAMVKNANIRVVVDWNVPTALCAYYQKISAIASHGKSVHCRWYYSRVERDKCAAALVQESRAKYDSLHGGAVVAYCHTILSGIAGNFEAVVRFAEERSCRHECIARYFGDDQPVACKTGCDWCMERERVECDLKRISFVALPYAIRKFAEERVEIELYEGCNGRFVQSTDIPCVIRPDVTRVMNLPLQTRVNVFEAFEKSLKQNLDFHSGVVTNVLPSKISEIASMLEFAVYSSAKIATSYWSKACSKLSEIKQYNKVQKLCPEMRNLVKRCTRYETSLEVATSACVNVGINDEVAAVVDTKCDIESQAAKHKTDTSVSSGKSLMCTSVVDSQSIMRLPCVDDIALEHTHMTGDVTPAVELESGVSNVVMDNPKRKRPIKEYMLATTDVPGSLTAACDSLKRTDNTLDIHPKAALVSSMSSTTMGAAEPVPMDTDSIATSSLFSDSIEEMKLEPSCSEARGVWVLLPFDDAVLAKQTPDKHMQDLTKAVKNALLVWFERKLIADRLTFKGLVRYMTKDLLDEDASLTSVKERVSATMEMLTSRWTVISCNAAWFDMLERAKHGRYPREWTENGLA